MKLVPKLPNFRIASTNESAIRKHPAAAELTGAGRGGAEASGVQRGWASCFDEPADSDGDVRWAMAHGRGWRTGATERRVWRRNTAIASVGPWVELSCSQWDPVHADGLPRRRPVVCARGHGATSPLEVLCGVSHHLRSHAEPPSALDYLKARDRNWGVISRRRSL